MPLNADSKYKINFKSSSRFGPLVGVMVLGKYNETDLGSIIFFFPINSDDGQYWSYRIWSVYYFLLFTGRCVATKNDGALCKIGIVLP